MRSDSIDEAVNAFRLAAGNADERAKALDLLLRPEVLKPNALERLRSHLVTVRE